MILTESQLRRYIRRALSESHVSYDLSDPVNDPRIPPEDMPIIKTVANTTVGRDATLEVTDDDVHMSIFSPRGETIAFLNHDLKTDTWTGSGPSPQETASLGEREIDHEDVMDFAKNFGHSEGPIDRRMGAISDFFTL